MHIINWIKFKVQKVLGIHDLIEKVDILEKECVNLSAQLGSTTGGTLSNRENINKLFATTSGLRALIEQSNNEYQLGSKDYQWDGEDEIDYIQKNYE